MNQKEILDKAYEYALQIKNSCDYQRLLRLKDDINTRFLTEIKEFKELEAKYAEAKKYGKYYPNLKEIQIQFSLAKKKLFSEPLVQEYKQLEKKLNDEVNDFIGSIKKNLSNKFDSHQNLWK